MANFFSASQEEQQEILLSIWHRFKYAIIGFFVLLILFIVVKDYVNDSRNERELKTSLLFQEYLESEEYMPSSGQKLLDFYPKTLYSDFVRLNQAKKEFLKNEKDKAIDLLQLVIDRHSESSNEFNPLVAAAQTRLCRIYISKKDYQKVLDTLSNSEVLTASLLELKGDAESELGQYDLARVSYMRALQNSPSQTSRTLINMKISDLEGEKIE
jgi:predicted negative regulator of RcsB-dependent stress response